MIRGFGGSSLKPQEKIIEVIIEEVRKEGILDVLGEHGSKFNNELEIYFLCIKNLGEDAKANIREDVARFILDRIDSKEIEEIFAKIVAEKLKE